MTVEIFLYSIIPYVFKPTTIHHTHNMNHKIRIENTTHKLHEQVVDGFVDFAHTLNATFVKVPSFADFL